MSILTGRFVGALFGATLLAAAGSKVTAQEYVFTLHHFLNAQHSMQTQVLEPWAEELAERSDGRIHVDIYPSMTLGGTPAELVSQVRDGVVDMVWTANGYTPGLHSRSEVMELPTVFPGSAETASLVLFDVFDDLAEDYPDTKVLWLHTHGGNALHTATQAVRSVEDIEGLVMRAPSRIGAWTAEALGATPVAMPIGDLPQALQRGEVEGAMNPFEVMPPLSLQGSTQYHTEGHDGARFDTLVFQVSMNQVRWDGLPDDIREIFEETTARAFWGEVGRIWDENESWGLGEMLEAGNEHIVLSEEATADFREALYPLEDRWIRSLPSGVDGTALIERIREATQTADQL